MENYGEPWQIIKQPSGLKLLCDREGNIIPFIPSQKQRVVACINFATGANLDEFIEQNWQSLIERMHEAEHDLEEERENFKQLQYAYQQLAQDHIDLINGLNRMGLNHSLIIYDETENRRNGIS